MGPRPPPFLCFLARLFFVAVDARGAVDAPAAAEARDAGDARDAADAPAAGDAGTRVLPVAETGGLGGETTNGSSIPAHAADTNASSSGSGTEASRSIASVAGPHSS